MQLASILLALKDLVPSTLMEPGNSNILYFYSPLFQNYFMIMLYVQTESLWLLVFDIILRVQVFNYGISIHLFQSPDLENILNKT